VVALHWLEQTEVSSISVEVGTCVNLGCYKLCFASLECFIFFRPAFFASEKSSSAHLSNPYNWNPVNLRYQGANFYKIESKGREGSEGTKKQRKEKRETQPSGWSAWRSNSNWKEDGKQ
jgi:hypothetical protein